jgi:hypothetical protein
MTALTGQPFEHETRFREAIARQTELVQALDLTKNQNVASLSAGAPETPALETTPASINRTVQKVSVVVSIGTPAK